MPCGLYELRPTVLAPINIGQENGDFGNWAAPPAETGVNVRYSDFATTIHFCGRMKVRIMRFRWPGLLSAKSPNVQSKYDLQAAPEFLFEQRPFDSECAGRTPGQRLQPGTRLAVAGQAPYLRTRLEDVTVSRTEVPALTIVANPSERVEITGSNREDWSLRFCAYGEGSSEDEASGRLREVSLNRVGGTISLNGPGIGRMVGAGGNLIVEAPLDAPITVHASFAPVEVRNMTGPVRVTAIHARAKVLNATGQVDATGFVVDFAGSKGPVILSAEAEINLKLTAAMFQGSLTAWAQGPVRVLVPRAFHTPFQAVVNRPEDFTCRTEFSANVKPEKNGSLYVFTYPGDGSTPPKGVHLRSEHATVVIDTAS